MQTRKSRSRIVRGIISLCVFSLLFTFFLTPAPGQSKPSLAEVKDLKSLVQKTLNLEKVDFQELYLPMEGWAPVSTTVDLGGKICTLSLSPYSVRAWDFKLLVQGADGKVVEQEAPLPRTYEGTVDGYPDSGLTASLVDGELSAMIYLTPEEMWLIQPLSEVVSDGPVSSHLVYNVKDVVAGDEEWTCGTDLLDPINVNCGCANTTGGNVTMGVTGLMICDIAFDSDYEFYKKNGYSVTNTVNDIEKIVNGMRTAYERDIDISYELTTVVVRTAEPDPYSSTDPGTLLDQFKVEWNNNLGGIKRDTAHLMTGKNLNGSVIGVAWPGVVCAKTMAYGLSQSKFTTNLKQRVALTCHEVGHNWSAVHCDGDSDCHIMCSVLGGCSGIGLPTFGSKSINKISQYRDNAYCLWEQYDPLSVPFSETWVSTDLDRERWSYKNGTSIESIAVNEPSPPYSIKLDASGPDLYEVDELRSNFILLGGLSGIELSYYTQHRGVENGEKLVVEYWNSNGDWQEINSITSNGVDQTSFDFHSHTLTTLAYHDEFRVRFRTEVNAENDNWFIDDIFVGTSLPDPPTITAVNPKAGIEAGGTAITVNGTNFSGSPAMTIQVGGVSCTGVNVVNTTTLTCNTGTNSSGFKDVEVSNIYGNDTLTQAYRYFPVNVDPFNATDIETISLDTPVDFYLIVSGYPSNPFLLFFSYTGGPLSTPYGTMGLGFPIFYLFASNLNAQGYQMIPLHFDSGFGPFDLFFHSLGLNGSAVAVWASGGNNPNGSGSVQVHLNN